MPWKRPSPLPADSGDNEHMNRLRTDLDSDSTSQRALAYAALTAALIVLGGLIALIVGASLGTRYSSVGRVLVRPPLTAEMVVTGNPGAAEDIQRVVDTDVEIAGSRDFLSLVAERAKSPGVGTDSLMHDLTVTAPTGTDVLLFTASEPYAQTASQVAGAAVDEFVSYLNGLSGDVSTISSTDPTVQAALARLKVLEQLVPPATIVERASAPTQTLPNHSRDLLVGVTAGLVVALIVIALRESVRRSPTR